MAYIDGKHLGTTPHHAKQTEQGGHGFIGLAVFALILAALAASTYFTAPPQSSGSRDSPSISWGGR